MRLLSLTAAALAVAVLASAGFAQAPGPLAMGNSAIGGTALNQYTPGVEGGVGLNNIGLLIKTWGRVTFVDEGNSFFYIDDGTAGMDGSSYLGIRVTYSDLAPGNTIDPPDEDSYVMVTCISSTVLISDKIQPNLRPRRQDDIQPVWP